MMVIYFSSIFLNSPRFSGSSTLKLPKNRAKSNNNFDFEQGKYAGSAVSRKELFGDISEISGLQGKDSGDSGDSEDGEDEEDEEEEEDDVEEEEKTENGVKMDSDDEEDDFDDEEEEENDSEADSDAEVPSKLKMTTLSLNDDSDKADKATSVRRQRQVWDDLMYSNIRMHALLNSVNQMPRGDARKNLLKNCDEKTRESLMNVLANMAKLRNAIQEASDTFGGSGKKGDDDEDDEEIPSDEDEEIPSDEDENMDDEEEEGDGEEEDLQKTSSESGTSLKTLSKNLAKQDQSMEKFRATTITKWYNRTKLLNSKAMNNTDFSVFEKGSILGQITKVHFLKSRSIFRKNSNFQVLNDEEKLLKKVRTNRTGNRRLGTSASSGDIDNEIFDDSDFYQVLLKQMLESRSQNQNQDGADMTRSYMELQSMFNNKKKRDVSQLSSKDRRLKYEPIAKLINFYPSKPSVVTWSHESRNELFKSLFS